MQYLIKNVSIVNEGKISHGDVLIKDQIIEKIAPHIQVKGAVKEIDAEGKTLIPGVIDEHVHFREPGLTDKAEIKTESRAAVAGGVTSFMEMPNTIPPVLTEEILENKYIRASQSSLANYSFYMGVSHDNLEEVYKMNKRKQEVCGVKIFIGSTTGNMLVDDEKTLSKIFGKSELLIATHCENEAIVQANLAKFIEEKGEAGLELSDHPLIRNVEGCYTSSKSTIALAQKFDTRLHIVHITTGREVNLFTNQIPLEEKRITSEVCVHHLWFTSDDYEEYGNKIKCNPAIKAPKNKSDLWGGLLDDRLDCIATDNAPHTAAEKTQPFYKAPAGIPLVQHGLLMMLNKYKDGVISLEKIVEKMCHNPAICYQVEKRGYIREGYYADLVLLDLNQDFEVNKKNIYFKCGWSPLEGHIFPAKVEKTFVNGNMVYDNGKFNDESRGMRLKFDR